MIKANELQIGDWVQNPLGYKAQVLDIHYIKDEGDGYGGGYRIHIGKSNWGAVQWLEEKDIEPIPLTPEILEKNGFRDISTHTLKGAETFELWLGDYKLTYKLNDYFALDSLDDRWYRLFETQFCHKWCVHHLQHALKLCGIEKEIIL